MESFCALTLNDRAVFEQNAAQSAYENTNHYFANLYVWRHAYHIRFKAFPEGSMVCGAMQEEGPYHLWGPMIAEGHTAREVLTAAEAACAPRPLQIYGVDRAFVEAMQAEGIDGDYVITEDRDNADYIYRTEDLASLTGKRYHGKRNHVNGFLKKYTYATRAVTPDDEALCLAIFDAWNADREPDAMAQPEREAISGAIREMEALGLDGLILYANGEPAAFCLGVHDPKKDAVLVLFEKAVPQVSGAFPFINQQFAQRWLGRAAWIDRAEDMGIEGLRKAKLSYHPDHLAMHYSLTRRDEP